METYKRVDHRGGIKKLQTKYYMLLCVCEMIVYIVCRHVNKYSYTHTKVHREREIRENNDEDKHT